MKFTGDIAEVKLTQLQTGDLDNSVYLSYFDGNPDVKKKQLEVFIKNKNHNPIDDLVNDVIFSGGNISDDVLRRCTIMLTFFNAISEITGTEPMVKNAKALYFALIVNWNASKGNGQNKIKSASAMAMAVDVTPELDYREYIVNGGGEDSKFDGEYKSIRVINKEFSSEIEFKLPIIKGLLGTFRFCTDGVAGMMKFSNDEDSTEYMVPASVWLNMIAEAMGKRLTTRFSSLENGRLHKLVKLELRTIEDLLSINNFKVATSFINAYDTHIDNDFRGRLELLNTNEPPELPEGGSEEDPIWSWVDRRGGAKCLFHKGGMYYVTFSGSAIKIWLAM